MNAKIAVLAGDGVGREIVPEAIKVFCLRICTPMERWQKSFGLRLPETHIIQNDLHTK